MADRWPTAGPGERVGLTVETTTVDPVAEGYMVAAVKEDVEGRGAV